VNSLHAAAAAAAAAGRPQEGLIDQGVHATDRMAHSHLLLHTYAQCMLHAVLYMLSRSNIFQQADALINLQCCSIVPLDVEESVDGCA